MFVRLFVDENLDRMVPISKQPKDKIQAILEACDRQFPEFHERSRKRIRTYLKSCRRMRRSKEQNGWEPVRNLSIYLFLLTRKVQRKSASRTLMLASLILWNDVLVSYWTKQVQNYSLYSVASEALQADYIFFKNPHTEFIDTISNDNVLLNIWKI